MFKGFLSSPYLSECLLTYDIVYAIDTNSIKTKSGLFVSVGCAMEIDDFYQKVKNRETKLTIICRETMFAHREIQLGEKLSLIGLISLILKEKISKNPDLKVGIVTDHDLGNIDKYNSRKIPILNSLYLPENIKLIYASADKKNASFLNQLMSMCDKRATEILNRLNLPK